MSSSTNVTISPQLKGPVLGPDLPLKGTSSSDNTTSSKSPQPVSSNQSPAGDGRGSIAQAVGNTKETTKVAGIKTTFTSSGKGGGAFRSINEDYNSSTKPVLTIPIQLTPGRGGVTPDLDLSYDPGMGNGIFGFGWHLTLPSIHRKTSKMVPQYSDTDEITFAGLDLVPRLATNAQGMRSHDTDTAGDYRIARFLPVVDSRSMRIERWTHVKNTADVHWRVISSENVTSIFGQSDESRILDKTGSQVKIFSWLLARSYDAFGNATEYSYKPEDGYNSVPDRSWEKSRSTWRQKYIKGVKYGNRTPYRLPWSPQADWPADWLFEVLFDYGEHSGGDTKAFPTTEGIGKWITRKDVFSQSKAGFDIRTYRLCQRILMFHHNPSRSTKGGILVHSTSFLYNETEQRTVLSQATDRGFKLKPNTTPPEYEELKLPPRVYKYSECPTSFQLPIAEDANQIVTTDGSTELELADVDGVGIPGLLLKRVTPQQLSYRDPLTGTTRDIVLDPMPKREEKLSFDHVNTAGFVTTGVDGAPIRYHERLSQTKYDSAFVNRDTAPQTTNPSLIYPAANQMTTDTSPIKSTFRSVDMTGDGLENRVELSEGMIRYWPNNGSGQVGDPIVMGSSPKFEVDGSLDFTRIHLADVDGSGTADLIYVRPNGQVKLFYNYAGNSWSNECNVEFTADANLKDVHTSMILATDLLGKGTACLCWVDVSSPSATSRGTVPIKYVDLCGHGKPHMLTTYDNGTGTTTEFKYVPSTVFLRQDLKNGKTWSSELPFPVQCLNTVTVRDSITGNVSSTEYTYHNGYYDPSDRCVVGFEHVNTFHRDSLVLSKNVNYDTVWTEVKTWFSTGRDLNVDNSRFFEKISSVSSQYQDKSNDAKEPPSFKSLRGSVIRSEVYESDGKGTAGLPFEVIEHSYDVTRIQRGVFQKIPRASVTTRYEKSRQDPRVSYDIVLKTNDYGDVMDSITIVLPREQQKAESTELRSVIKNQTLAKVLLKRTTFTEAVDLTPRRDFTKDYSDPNKLHFRKPVPWRQQEFDVKNLLIPKYIDVGNMREVFSGRLVDDQDTLLSETRQRFRGSDLISILPWGSLEAFSVLERSYTLTYTRELLSQVKDSLPGFSLSLGELMVKGGYVDLETNGNYWAPSASIQFKLEKDGGPSALETARENFYQPRGILDAFGKVIELQWKDRILMEKVTDPLGNATSFAYDDNDRMCPINIRDPNGNNQKVEIDALGRTIATAVRGKETVEDFLLPVAEDGDVIAILNNPFGEKAGNLLGRADTRTIYRPRTGTTPSMLMEIARDKPYQTREEQQIHVTVSYLDGAGRVMQRSTLYSKDVQSRCLCEGTKVMDSHGSIVRIYDPVFAPSMNFIPIKDMEAPSTTVALDGMGRQVAVRRPDASWTKTVYGTWMMTEYTASDLIEFNPCAEDSGVGRYFPEEFKSQLTWYADKLRNIQDGDQNSASKSKKYGVRPSSIHLGIMGMPIARIRKDSDDKTYTDVSDYDASGNLVEAIDSLNRRVSTSVYDLTNRLVKMTTMEGGVDWTLRRVTGQPLMSWNSRMNCMRYEYDDLGREIMKGLVTTQDPDGQILVKRVYGEASPTPENLNLRGRLWQIKDQSGVHINKKYDVEGRCIEKTFQFAESYSSIISWGKMSDKLAVEPTVKLVQQEQLLKRTFDNSGRPIADEDEKGNRILRSFTPSDQLKKLDAFIAGSTTPILESMSYTDDGLPKMATYGNKAKTEFKYDKNSRDLTEQVVTNEAKEVLQQLINYYDCEGRRIYTNDKADQRYFFTKSAAPATWEFTYDTIGQLIASKGRAWLPELTKSTSKLMPYNVKSSLDKPAKQVVDGAQTYSYSESYVYDVVGNIRKLTHLPDAVRDESLKRLNGWSKQFSYEKGSKLDPEKTSNMLSGIAIEGSSDSRFDYSGKGGEVGCMTGGISQSMEWDTNEMMSSSTASSEPGAPKVTTYFVYDYAGNRRRKVTESTSPGAAPIKILDTRSSFFTCLTITPKSTLVTLLASISPDTSIPALAQISPSSSSSPPSIRFNVGTNLTLNASGKPVQYAEFTPFGTPTFNFSSTESPSPLTWNSLTLDPETRLYAAGTRAYAPELCRFTSPDPLRTADGPNMLAYCRNDPINFVDTTGTMRMAMWAVGTRVFETRGPLGNWMRSGKSLRWRDENQDDRDGILQRLWAAAAEKAREIREEWKFRLCAPTAKHLRLSPESLPPTVIADLPPSTRLDVDLAGLPGGELWANTANKSARGLAFAAVTVGVFAAVRSRSVAALTRIVPPLLPQLSVSAYEHRRPIGRTMTPLRTPSIRFAVALVGSTPIQRAFSLRDMTAAVCAEPGLYGLTLGTTILASEIASRTAMGISSANLQVFVFLVSYDLLGYLLGKLIDMYAEEGDRTEDGDWARNAQVNLLVYAVEEARRNPTLSSSRFSRFAALSSAAAAVLNWPGANL